MRSVRKELVFRRIVHVLDARLYARQVNFVPGPAISIDKTTNGSDGPIILVGQPVAWSYLVTNTGNVALTGVSVSDDKGVSVSCPKTSGRDWPSSTSIS